MKQLFARAMKASIIILTAMLLLTENVWGGAGRHDQLYVVPAAGEVKIDGILDEWDFSGHIDFYVVPETKETQSAVIGMMYDDDAVYIGGTVRDSSPMMNRHDPQTKPSRAWDADVCQIFFSIDPDDEQPLKYSSFRKEDKDVSPVATMMLWYFTDREEPALAMFRGMGFTKALHPDIHENGHITAKHFDAAYKKGDDELSYTFEYRIPWETMAVKRIPKAGDNLAAAMAVFWGRRDGLKTAGGAAWAWNVMSVAGFPYQSSGVWGTWRFWSEGNIPREWVDGKLPPEQPLPLKFSYNLPREGESTIQFFDENDESMRILVAQQRRPEGVNTERWDGLDDDGKPLPAGKYSWRGVVHDPINVKYRFSVHNSGNPPYPTDDNTGGWGGDHGRPSTVLRIKDGMILAWDSCEFGWGLIRTDLDGRKKWGSKRTAEYLATDGERLFIAGGHGWSAGGGVTVIELSTSRTLNFQPGMERLLAPKGGENDDNKVTGLACDGKQIYVAYGGRNMIGVYTPEGNLAASWDVQAPGQLAMRADGSLVALSDDRVVVLRDGRIINKVTDVLTMPRGIAVSKNDEIFVAQAGNVQQVKVYDLNGKLLRTIGKDGGRPAKGTYDVSGMYEPGGIDVDEKGRLWVAETTDGPKRISVWDSETGKNVNEFFGGSAYFAYGTIDPARPDEIYAHHVLWKIDWKKYKTRPLTTIWRKTAPDMMPPPNCSGHNGSPRLMTAENGHQYMFGRTSLLLREGDLLKPFLAVFRDRPFDMLGEEEPTEQRHRLREPQLWQDFNNDGCVQVSELTALPPNKFGKPRISLAHDLRLYMNDGYVLTPVRFTETGQPVYDFAAAKPSPVGLAPDSDGFVYPDYASPQISKRTVEGDVLWSYSDIEHWKRSLGKPVIKPGRLWGTTGKLGVAGDYLAYMVYWGVNHVFHTPSGVYVAALLSDGRIGQSSKHQGSQPEGQGGSFVKLNIEGKDRYFIIHGGQDSRVWEVLGLENVQTLKGGTYEHTAEAVQSTTQALAEWKAAIAGDAQMTVVRGLDTLDNAKPIGKEIEGDRGFDVSMAYDDVNLYIHYDVTSPHPLKNTLPEDLLIFRGGNCLDIQLATDPKADPKRNKPAPGDVRVLVTRKDGKPFSMVYRTKVKDFKGEPIVLSSPTGSESFDNIESTDRVKLDYNETDKGFTALVTVPLDLFGLQPESGDTVKLDLGYIFGNATGSRTAARAYLHNNSFSANVVDDIPNESRLEPGEWGTATFE